MVNTVHSYLLFSVHFSLAVTPIDIELFSWLFDLFLDSSKKFASDPKGKDIIAALPNYLPEDRNNIPNRFLSLTNDCFRMSLVVDFYIWLISYCSSFRFGDNEHLYNLIEEYKHKMGNNRNSVINRFISYPLFTLGKEYITKLDFEVNENSLIEMFLQAKRAGIKISFGSQKISNTKWSKSSLIINKKNIHGIFRKFARVRNYKGIIDNHFIYSISLNDYLQVMENESITNKEIEHLNQFIPWLIEQPNTPSDYRKSLEHFFSKMPSKATEMNSHISINFISRYDYVTQIKLTLEECSSINCYSYTVYLLLAGFCALRRQEAMGIRVGNFVLDKENLIADMNDGYGMLILPKNQSKGNYSPSLEGYHIAVVPRVRNFINLFLKSDFMAGYNHDTFLMRSVPVNKFDKLYDDLPKNYYQNGEWLRKISDRGDYIMRSIYNRCKFRLECKKRIGTHDLRRSINQFISSTPSKIPNKDRIAEIHLRHAKKGSTNQIHYQDEPPLEAYIICIDNALNFPWDYDDLEEWEKNHQIGYDKKDWGEVNGIAKYPSPCYYSEKMWVNKNDSNNKKETEILQIYLNQEDNERKELDKKIADIRSQLANKPKNRIALNAQLKRLEEQLKSMKN